MTTATLTIGRDALLPQRPGGNGAGAVLALLVHAALLLALTSAVDWRSQPADVVSAELWASVPQAAGPAPTPAPAATAAAIAPAPVPAPTPPTTIPAPAAQPAARLPAAPQPIQPDIATERAEQRRQAAVQKKKAAAEAESQRIATEKQNAAAVKQQREQEAAAAKADEQRLARQRDENLKRMMGEAGSAGGRSGSAAHDAAPSAAYAGRLAGLIRSQSVFTGTVPGNPAAEVEVTAAANGTIIARRLVKSSGYKDWDDAVLRAIDKVGTLPRDTDGRVPPRLTVAFKPNE